MSIHNEQCRVVASNLHLTGIEEADRIADILKSAGWPRATRSLVIREALHRLHEDLLGKTPEEVFHYFLGRRGSRTKTGTSTSGPAGARTA
jgi:hypothetical protein